MSEDKSNQIDESSESLSKTDADDEIKKLKERVAELTSEKNSKNKDPQSEWEIEAKRIQEIKNEQKPTDRESKLQTDTESEENNMKEIYSELLTEPVAEPAPEPVAEPAPEPVAESTDEKIDESVDTSVLEEISEKIQVEEKSSESLLETVSDAEVNSRISFEEFTDEKTLISHDVFGNKQMKIKVLEVSDEIPPVQWKFGDRVKITKILVTIKHLTTQEVEEGEFDIEAIERELAEKRHYTSTNRWVPSTDIKNGYVIGSMHTRLISDASALDYIVF